MFMKNLITIFNIILLASLASGCAYVHDHPEPASEPKVWQFVHIADEAKVPNSDTIMMSVAQAHGIYASTDGPYREHKHLNAKQLASMWADSFKVAPPNAMLTWTGDNEPQQIEIVITDARSDGNTIIYTFEANEPMKAGGTLSNVTITVRPNIEPKIMKSCAPNCPDQS
jgi:hypothetical protein|tara:strand:+ start:315 stop:824 length:510 start_codon:yes stop_codon:yes gene_type:complete